MKKFLSENWFKLMTGTSMLVFSFGFLLYAVSPTYANNSNKTEKQKVENTNYVNVPVNKDGSVNIKLSDEQIELLKPPALQDVRCYVWAAGRIGKDDKWEKMWQP